MNMKNYIIRYYKHFSIILIVNFGHILFSHEPIYPHHISSKNCGNTIELSNIKNKSTQNIRHSIDLSNNPYDEIIVKVSNSENVCTQLIRCIIKIESNFNKDAVSVAGAMGLMQLMQETAQAYNVDDPFDPEENITAGVRHIKYLLTLFNNDVVLALAAYHAGAGRVKRKMAVPNIKSTIEYVNKVMRIYQPDKHHNYTAKIEKLYMQILPDGTINITNKGTSNN